MVQTNNKLKEHKKNLDLILNHYSLFIPLVKAMNDDNIPLFKNCISNLKTFEPYLYQLRTLDFYSKDSREVFLDEIPFDLNPDEIHTLYDYGSKKLLNIESAFAKIFQDAKFDYNNNELFQELWQNKPGFDIIIPAYSKTNEGFIILLCESLKNKLSEFHKNYEMLFTSYLKPRNQLGASTLLQKEAKPIKLKAKKEKKLYSHKQIAIAYWAMGVWLTKDNSLEILEKHSKNRSIDKLLREQVKTPSKLTTLSKNKTADTKHLRCLIAAKQLLSGTRVVQNNVEAIQKIDRILKAFTTSYEAEY